MVFALAELMGHRRSDNWCNRSDHGWGAGTVNIDSSGPSHVKRVDDDGVMMLMIKIM